MMGLLRNREVRRTLLLHLLLSAAGIIAACLLGGMRFAILVCLLCAALAVLHLVSDRLRYRRIAMLAAEIDRVLHGEDPLSPDSAAEGELSILRSEIHKMTTRLREQQQRLLEDKRYLADSIADISHQLRTPLTSINLLVEFLSEPELPAERRLQLCRELRELLSRIDWLIVSLLKISRLDAGTVSFKTETAPLSQLIRQSCAPLLIPIELRGQTLEIRTEGDFTGDIGWTMEAIGNIVKNCMEHTPEGGILRIDAADNPLYTEIRIADNGPGIAPEDLPHIFERFYKGKHSSDKSFGIGLALARMIIAKQNGTIRAENPVTGGACFTIRFFHSTV